MSVKQSVEAAGFLVVSMLWMMSLKLLVLSYS
jgi:hypothetical protein